MKIIIRTKLDLTKFLTDRGVKIEDKTDNMYYAFINTDWCCPEVLLYELNQMPGVRASREQSYPLPNVRPGPVNND